MLPSPASILISTNFRILILCPVYRVRYDSAWISPTCLFSSKHIQSEKVNRPYRVRDLCHFEIERDAWCIAFKSVEKIGYSNLQLRPVQIMHSYAETFREGVRKLKSLSCSSRFIECDWRNDRIIFPAVWRPIMLPQGAGTVRKGNSLSSFNSSTHPMDYHANFSQANPVKVMFASAFERPWTRICWQERLVSSTVQWMTRFVG